jgi:hypothetical protein
MTLTPTTRLARSRWWPGVAAWALWTLTMLALPVIAWLDQLSRQAGRPELAQLTLGSVVGPVLAAVSAATAGAVLASRRPRHPVGWLLLALGLSAAWAGVPPGLCRLRAPGPPRRPPRRPRRRPLLAHHHRHHPDRGQLCPAAHPHRQAALTPLALVGPGHRGRRGHLAGCPGGGQGTAGPAVPGARWAFDLRGQGGVLLVVNQLALAATTLAVVVGAASLVVRFRRAHGWSASSCAGWPGRPQ